MTIIYDKPFKTYDEQITKIENKNVLVRDKIFAKGILSTISYHTLMNGYKDSLLNEKGTEHFIEGMTLEILYSIHLLDTKLNSLLFKNILYTERSLKTKISYLVAEEFGVFSDFSDMNISKSTEDYLSSPNYSNRNKQRISTLKSLKYSVINCKRNRYILIHYKTEKNHIPPWILASNLTFSLVIMWYNILKDDEKTMICQQMLPYNTCQIDEKKELLKTALDLLNCYRNNIAHGHRTFNKDIKDAVAKPGYLNILQSNVLSDFEYNKSVGKNDLFAIILIIMILNHDEYIVSNFVNELVQILLPYKDIKISNKTIFQIFDLPPDLFIKLENLQENKNKSIHLKY